MLHKCALPGAISGWTHSLHKRDLFHPDQGLHSSHFIGVICGGQGCTVCIFLHSQGNTCLWGHHQQGRVTSSEKVIKKQCSWCFNGRLQWNEINNIRKILGKKIQSTMALRVTTVLPALCREMTLVRNGAFDSKWHRKWFLDPNRKGWFLHTLKTLYWLDNKQKRKFSFFFHFSKSLSVYHYTSHGAMDFIIFLKSNWLYTQEIQTKRNIHQGPTQLKNVSGCED